MIQRCPDLNWLQLIFFMTQKYCHSSCMVRLWKSCVSFLCLPLALNYVWGKSCMFLEAETVCSQDSEGPVHGYSCKACPFGMVCKNAKLWWGLMSTYHPRPHFHTQSAVSLLSLADEGVTKRTILLEAVVISTVPTLSSVCALNYQSTSYSIASTINSKCHSKPACSQVLILQL